MALDFSASTPINQVAGYVFLDIDEDPTTGIPADAAAGKPTQDVGIEYLVDLFSIQEPDPVAYIVDAETFELVAAVPVTFDGQSVLFDIPLEAIGGDDGSIATAMVLGDFSAPMDWAPDEGHGTIQPFSDVPWIVPDPAAGQIEPGASQVMNVTLGGAGLQPGTYAAQLVLVTNDPLQPQIPIDISLTVTMPEEFGSIGGMVTDAHTDEPLPGVAVTVHAEWPAGTPLDLTTTTDAEGAWSVIGPEGTWPADFTLEGFVPVTRDVTIVRGVATGGADAALHRIQPHAVLEGEVPVFILTPDRQGSATVTISNPDGHAPLEIEVGEVDLGGPVSTEAVAGRTVKRVLPAGANPNARSNRANGVLATGRSVPKNITAVGDVISSFSTDMTLPWGVGYDGGLWISDPEDLIDAHFSTAGDRDDEFDTSGVFDIWGADMAVDTAREPHLAGQRGRRQRHLRPRPGRRLGRASHHRRAVGRHQPARPRLRPGRRRVLHRWLERRHRLSRRRPVASDAGRDAQPVPAARSEHLRARLEPLVRDALDVDELRYRLDLADRSDHLRVEREHPASGWRRRQRRRPRAGCRRQPVDRRPELGHRLPARVRPAHVQ